MNNVIRYNFEQQTNIAFSVMVYNLKNAIARHFNVPARFECEKYKITWSEQPDSFYIDVCFPDESSALLFKLGFTYEGD